MSDSVKSALRALQIIDLLTERPHGVTFPEICDRLGLAKSSAHALLHTMVDHGHLTVDPVDRLYRLGIRQWEAGQAYQRGFHLPSLARPYLQAASEELRETVQLAVLNGTENVYIDKVEADQRLVLVSEVGSRLPAYATGLGKMLLASLSDDEVRRRFEGHEFEQFTENTLRDVDELLARLAEIRQQGYATDDSEYTEGVHCIAVPISHRSWKVIAAMSVSVPKIRFGRDRRRLILQTLRHQAWRLSAELGADVAEGLG